MINKTVILKIKCLFYYAHYWYCCSIAVLFSALQRLCYHKLHSFVYQFVPCHVHVVCEIRREDDAHIHKIFQDPKAQHLLVCMVSKETYYVPREGPKRPQPRLLQKLKGYLIESVGWNMVEQSGQSTGAILFGTNEGTCGIINILI